MIYLMLKIVQLDDKYKFSHSIYRHQKRCGDPNPEHIHAELGKDGQMFSSSGRGGGILGEGIRFKPIDIDFEKWDIYPLLITKEQEDGLWGYFHKLMRKRKFSIFFGWYDWLGIIGMPLPGNIQLGFWYYCIEILNCGLRALNIFNFNRKQRPGQTYEAYKKAGLIGEKITDIAELLGKDAE